MSSDESNKTFIVETNVEQSLKDLAKLTCVVLAAGKGTRMKSPLPKVLHPVAGRPMIEKVIRASQKAGASEIRLVVGHGQQLVKSVVEPMGVSCHVQEQQLGTANAVASAGLDSLEGDVVIMNGDHPLIEATDIKEFIAAYRELKADVAVVTAVLKKPAEFGRILRKNGQLRAIVEAKEASSEILKIREVNTGIYIVKSSVLQKFLPQIKNQNEKKEFYLTDLISLTIQAGLKVEAIRTKGRVSVGVNSQLELARATKLVYKKKAMDLLEAGVLMIDPTSTYVEESVQVGAGSVLYPNVFLRGKTEIGSFSVIESNCFISDSKIADSVQVKAGSYIERTEVQAKCSVGPYARLRPDTVLMEDSHVGNFVELKKVKFGKRSKAGHLTYLGDAEIGEDVNIGCGTITCNYAVDRKKYKTKIGDRVFVGSDSQFVAPVEVGDDAIIASGSTVTSNVPAQALAVARGRQKNIENYAEKLSKKNEASNNESRKDESGV